MEINNYQNRHINGMKTDSVIDIMWDQVRKNSSVRVSQPVKIDDNTLQFTVGKNGQWTYKIFMYYDKQYDTYSMKMMRSLLDYNSNDFGKNEEVEEGWLDGLYTDNIDTYIERRYKNRNKWKWVDYQGYKRK